LLATKKGISLFTPLRPYSARPRPLLEVSPSPTTKSKRRRPQRSRCQTKERELTSKSWLKDVSTCTNTEEPDTLKIPTMPTALPFLLPSTPTDPSKSHVRTRHITANPTGNCPSLLLPSGGSRTERDNFSATRILIYCTNPTQELPQKTGLSFRLAAILGGPR